MTGFISKNGRPMVLLAALGLGAVVAATAPRTQAGVFFGGAARNNVGGVLVDAQGVVRNPERGALKELQQVRQEFLKEIPADLREQVKLRKVSLKQLQQAAATAMKEKGGVLPDDVRFMGGLQRVKYVMVYPELKDIVLVGPAEGWKIADTGEPVGITTGHPVMQFDDLVVALRTAAGTQRGPISCSIDPTQEGIKRLHSFLQTQPVMTSRSKQRILTRAEDELGMQKVTLSGVDPTSRFARILVAADYRMKRLAMGFDPAPIKGMPSYMQLASADRQQNLMPRWWLEDDYQPLLTDDKGLAWEIRGQGVKCKTEDEVIGADGSRRGTGKADPVASKWAQTMTDKYNELSAREPVFGQLRNCMDLAVVAALITSHDLAGKAGLDLSPALSSPMLMPDKYEEARELPTLANAVEKGKRWLISASGGVSIDPWRAASKEEKSDKIAPVHEDALPPAGASWWWN